MLVCFGMDVPSMVEDILSDEYEEGEILDDDILYENVSSLEEFSDVDDKKSGHKGVKTDSKKVKSKRKKEHKCKMNSLCRLERSGKHCYARIRKRRSSLELKLSRNSSCVNSEGDSDRKQRPQSAKSISPNRGFKRDTFSKESPKGKVQSEVRKRGSPYYFQHDNRLQPPKKVVPDRRSKKNRRSSVEDHRSGNRKRKSRSPSPKTPAVETNRAVAKSSLLERLVGSGSIPLKPNANETDVKPTDSEDQADSEPGSCVFITEPNLCPDSGDQCDTKDVAHGLCPADIPVPPTPKARSPEPPPQEFEELHLRLNALKTAIMKKHTVLKRKKRLASSKKRETVEDSFTEFALNGLLEDEYESIPTPPPPGIDWPLAPLDDNRWSDEDMVIDHESVYGDAVIESNIPASDPSLQNFEYSAVSSPSSHVKLPCCRGNPIPVITAHRRTREAEPTKKPPSSVIPVVYDSEEPASGSAQAQPPKYLKEINSNKPTRRIGGRGLDIHGKGSQGIYGKGRGSQGIHGKGSQGIHGRGSLGIHGKGSLGTHGKGSLGTHGKGSLGTHGKGSQSIHGKGRGSQGIHGKGKGSQVWQPRKRRNSIRQGLKQSIKSVQPSGRPSKALKDDDDEDELRQLALMSVRPKNTIKGGMLTLVGADLNPLSIDTSHLSTTEKVESPAKQQSLARPWDDVDEDILRAQLLSSLSRNIPNGPVHPDVLKQHSPIEVKKQIPTKKINKENLHIRRNAVAHLAAPKTQKKNPAKFVNPNVKPSLTPPLNPPKMEKFIIKVSDSETSDDEELKGKSQVLSSFDALRRKSEIELSIDRLLEETRKETELIQKASQFYPDYNVPEFDHKKMPPDTVNEGNIKSVATLAVEPPLSPKEKIEEASPNSSVSHPQGLSRLPAWQQEEFERQKRVMAHKGSVIEATKQKIRGKTEQQKPSMDDAKSAVTPVKSFSSESADVSMAKPASDGPKTSCDSTKNVPIVDGLPPITTSEDSDKLTAPTFFAEVMDIVDSTKDLHIVASLPSITLSTVSDLNAPPFFAEIMDVVDSTMNLPIGPGLPSLTLSKDPNNLDAPPFFAEVMEIVAEPEDTVFSEVQKIVEGLLIRVCEGMQQGTPPSRSVASPTKSSVSGDSKELLEDVNVAEDQGKSIPEIKPERANQNNPSVANLPKPKMSLRNEPQLKPQLQNSSTVSLVNSKVIPGKGIVQRASPRKSLQNSAVPKNTSMSNAATKSAAPKIGTINGLAQKIPFVFKDSSYAAKALNEMVGMVNGFEDGMSEYKNLKKSYIAIRKQLVLAHQKMSKKRQDLLDMKGTIEKKRKLLDSTLTMDTSSLSPLPDPREQPKQSSRDSELFALRYKEVSLRAQFAMMELEAPSKPAAPATVRNLRPLENKPAASMVVKNSRPLENKPTAATVVKNSRPLENPVVSPRKKLRLKPRQVERLLPPPVEEKSVKPLQPVQTALNPVVPKAKAELPSSSKLERCVRDKDHVDPLIPMCPYDLSGVCKDEECKYQHVRTE